jgi:hypothetical protein
VGNKSAGARWMTGGDKKGKSFTDAVRRDTWWRRTCELGRRRWPLARRALEFGMVSGLSRLGVPAGSCFYVCSHAQFLFRNYFYKILLKTIFYKNSIDRVKMVFGDQFLKTVNQFLLNKFF